MQLPNRVREKLIIGHIAGTPIYPKLLEVFMALP